MKKLLLLCAATSVEAKACQSANPGPDAPYALEVLRTGMGLGNAERTLRQRLLDKKAPSPTWILSTGFAGSLKEEIAVGSWIYGVQVSSDKGEKLTLEPGLWASRFGNAELQCKPANLFSAEQICAPTARPLPTPMPAADAGADAADMESFALACVAREQGIPFEVIRLISDSPVKPIPKAILEFATLSRSEASTEARLASTLRGLEATLREPLRLARFIRQSFPLPKELTRGWKKALSDSEL